MHTTGYANKYMYKYMHNLSLWFLNGLLAEVMGQPLDPFKWSFATFRCDCRITICLELKSLYAYRTTFGSDGLSSGKHHRFPGWFSSNVYTLSLHFSHNFKIKTNNKIKQTKKQQKTNQTKPTNQPKKLYPTQTRNVIPIFSDRDLNSVGNA